MLSQSQFILNSLIAQIPQGGQASQIAADGAASSQAVAEAMNQLWEQTLNSSLYSALAQLGVFFAVGTLLIFMVQWFKALMDGDNPQAFSDIVWPLLVIVLLTNQAQVLSACTLQLRDIINQVNQGILTAQVGDLQLQEAYQQVVGQVGEQTVINALRSQCANIADPQQQQDCINQAAQQSGQLNNGQQSNDPFNIGQQFQNTISTIFAAAARGWLIAFGIAFQWLVEVSLLLTALLGPLAVGGSLLPVGQKAIFAWLTGFFSVGMVKLCFNIIAGLVASLVVNAGSVDSTIIAFAVGLLSPILAMALAAGGGMAIFNSLSNIATSGLGGLSRFLPRPDKFF